jgi:curli production assembly/transport component CsgF
MIGLNFIKRIAIVISLFVFCFCSSTYSQDLIYTPKNPAFGGNPYNYSWLLSSAQAQNGFEDPDATYRGFESENELESFQSSLNRQVLSQLSRKIIGDRFGTDGIGQGTYTIGDFTIDISESLDGVIITIIDLTTGGQSVIEVPYF